MCSRGELFFKGMRKDGSYKTLLVEGGPDHIELALRAFEK